MGGLMAQLNSSEGGTSTGGGFFADPEQVFCRICSMTQYEVQQIMVNL